MRSRQRSNKERNENTDAERGCTRIMLKRVWLCALYARGAAKLHRPASLPFAERDVLTDEGAIRLG